MAQRTGNLSIHSENIFPIIKKWLYSDHDIFYRELISNGCDAITKLKKLEMMGEAELAEDYKARIDVIVDPEKKTLTFVDNGLGMTEAEVEEYITQIAFSGATDFLEKYKDKSNTDQIIGHFGLGFYSAFMVADRVHIDSLSYGPGATAVHWECDGGTQYGIGQGDMDRVGTRITLFLNENSLEFCNEYKAREVIKKYCSFMPVEIYLSKVKETDSRTIDEEELLDSDVVLERLAPEKEEDKPRVKIRKRPELLNEILPLWAKNPSDCDKEQYLAFYRKVFQDYKEPLFWIHLNMDYPFRLKGILYFPKVNTEYENLEGVIKLYNNQVFIADNIKEVIPEFLLLLKGVIDCPDLPLNVSRSALQNDGFVKKISDYITKKVADKLSGMCKTEREAYEQHWDFIAPFVKYGYLKDEKFGEKINDYILFKDLEGKYQALPAYLEKEEGKAEAGEAVDQEGQTVDAQVVEDEEDGDAQPQKTIYYVSDELAQSQYIQMFKEAGMEAVLLTHPIDQHFLSRLEGKNPHVRFCRIDGDLTQALKEEGQEEDRQQEKEALEALFRKALGQEKLELRLERLKDAKRASLILLSEESRRMQEMMKMYSMPGMDLGDMGMEGQTLVLNLAHPLVAYCLEHGEGEHTELICRQLYDLAKLQHAPLNGEDMAAFVERSNQVLLLLAGER